MMIRDGSKCYVFDLETLGQQKNAVVVSGAFLAFDFKEQKTFEELLKETFYVKFSVNDQKANHGRTTDKSTIEWWMKQDPEVKAELAPSKLDMTASQASEAILAYLAQHGIHTGNPKKVFRFCRGQDFDIPILESLMASAGYELPGAFYNSRDIRTFVSAVIMDLNNTTIYKDNVEYKTLKGFKKHDARHDVAKAVLEMQMAVRLAMGEMEVTDL